MKQEQIICDNCEAVKKETNRWLHCTNYTDTFVISYDATNLDGIGILDLCGQKCAIDQLSKFLNQPQASPHET